MRVRTFLHTNFSKHSILKNVILSGFFWVFALLIFHQKTEHISCNFNLRYFNKAKGSGESRWTISHLRRILLQKNFIHIQKNSRRFTRIDVKFSPSISLLLHLTRMVLVRPQTDLELIFLSFGHLLSLWSKPHITETVVIFYQNSIPNAYEIDCFQFSLKGTTTVNKTEFANAFSFFFGLRNFNVF